MKFKVPFLLAALFLLVVLRSGAQTGDVRGFVYDKTSLQPITYINVFLQGTNYGTQTNADGYFTISQVPKGNYNLVVKGIGFDSLNAPVVITNGGIITKKLFVKSIANELGEVTVTAEQQAKKTEVRTSVITITPKEIKQIPTIGADPDLAQYLQVVPGVVSTGDQGGQLYIRGGSPDQNRVLLDGMTIYNPFHSIGLFSVFETDIIKEANVYAGGFGAQYGDAISSIIDVSTRDGNKKDLSGEVSTSTFMSKVLLEGPLKKAKDENDGTTSFILTAKTSYLQESSKTFYSKLDTTPLPFDFTDLYGKISFNSPSGNKFNIFGFHYSDNVDYPNVATLKWNSTGFGSNFVVVPASSTELIEGNFGYSNYSINLNQSALSPTSSSINEFNFALNFTYFLGKDELKYGLEVNGGATDLDFFNSINREINENNNTTEIAAYLKYKKILGNLVLEPSMRGTYYSDLSEFALEPRLGAKYNVTDKFRLKMAGGYYSQNLISTADQESVVNLFNGLIFGGQNLTLGTFNGLPASSQLQKSRHAIFGFEEDLPHHMTLNVEGYYKWLDQLDVLNSNKIFSTDPDFLVETGQAHGIDFLLKYDYHRLSLWAAYSLAYVTNFDGVETFSPIYDRRNNVNLVASYTFGKDLNWEVNGRWNYGSGFPFTLTQGFYELLPFTNGIYTNYTTANGQLGVQYASPNTGRLSDYHRLDFSVKRTFVISKKSTLGVVASVINVYDRDNIFYVNRITGQRVYQLPLLPSIGANLTF